MGAARLVGSWFLGRLFFGLLVFRLGFFGILFGILFGFFRGGLAREEIDFDELGAFVSFVVIGDFFVGDRVEQLFASERVAARGILDWERSVEPLQCFAGGCQLGL